MKYFPDILGYIIASKNLGFVNENVSNKMATK